ncbi:DUF4112 domain-containing protein [Alteromonas sp. 5E99-2]|uniref:DUF4112 domain-containing protein n=1 Tax=Alteromonas sp. 5E99-2 TaxID=2817683 RepID=UPI001F621CDA|nr:DUF4112 domain-containing protein [Alteromonas sp. 5E99-2]
MSTIAKSLPPEIVQAQNLANLFDTAITIPLIRVKLGLDFFLGLIPLIGDVIMLLLSLRIVVLGKALGMPTILIRKMMINALIDTVVGMVPFIGDILDVFFTANQRNVRVMETWWLTQNQLAT